MYYLRRRLPWLSVLITCTLLAGTSAVATESVSGTVSIATTSVAVGLGVDWGDGTLTLNDGRQYRFTVRGLELGGVGFAQVKAQGKVYNLANLADFEGFYVAGEASIALGSGPGVVVMHNEHGVVIDLQSMQEGAKLTIAAQGLQIAVKS